MAKAKTKKDDAPVIQEEEATQAALVPADDMPVMEPDPYDDYDDEYEGEEDDNQSIPKLIIVQKTHDDQVAAGYLGKLFSPEMDMAFDSLNVVMLLKWSSRVLWPDSFSKDNDPLCRSKDGKVPAGDIIDADGNILPAMAESCDWDKATLGKRGVRPRHICPYANWTEDEAGNAIPPACKEVINMILLDKDTEIPFHIALSSTALTPLKKELTRPMGYRKMAMTAKRRKAGLGKAMNCMFSFDLSVNPVDRESDSGSSKLPMFGNIQEISPDDIEMMLRWRTGIIPYVEMMKNAEFETAAGDSSGQEQADSGQDNGDDDDFA